jgi:SAM-dependent methyltransferase
MDDDAAQFTGSIPQYYDTGLGPVIFMHYADVVAGLVADGSPQRILETAAGTGLSSRAIAIANPGVELIVTDLNTPMLELARAKLPEGTRVETADAQALPFDDASFDTVVCQFGVMFLPDLAAGFREARRVLRSGGRFVFSVWDSHARNRFAAVVNGVITAHFPTDTPPFYRVPFAMSPVDPLRELAQDAGFGGVTIKVVPHLTSVPSWDAFADGLILGNPVSDQIRSRGGDSDAIRHDVIAALVSEFGAAPATMPIQALFYAAEAQ